MPRHDGWARFSAPLANEAAVKLLAVELHPDWADATGFNASLNEIESAVRAVLRLHDWPPGHGWQSESSDGLWCQEIGPDWEPDPDRSLAPFAAGKRESRANLRGAGLRALYWIAILRAAIGRGDALGAAAAAFQLATERGLIVRALEDGDRINKGAAQERRGRTDAGAERRIRARQLEAEGTHGLNEQARIISVERKEPYETVRSSLKEMRRTSG